MTLVPQHASGVPARPAPWTPRRAHLDLLAIYATQVGPAGALSTAHFLTSCGVLPASADAWAQRWIDPRYIWVAAAGWLAALWMIHTDLKASAGRPRPPDARRRWSDALGRRSRRAIKAGMGVSAALYALAAYETHWLMRGDVLWRWVVITPSVVLTLLVLDRHGITPGQIGLRRRRDAADAEAARSAVEWGMYAQAATLTFGMIMLDVALHLDPGMRAARGQGDPLPPFGLWSVVKIALMSLSAGIGEEMVLTALLVTVMLGAGQARWRWLLLAAVLRVPFHLWAGLFGFRVVVFAAVNAAIFARTRRILPIIAVHTVYDLLVALAGYTSFQLVRFGLPWQDVLLTVCAIPLMLGADHAASALRRRRAPTSLLT